jgi:hypothetical protein
VIKVSKIGTLYMPSGYQYFMQINMQRKRRGLAIMDLPPEKSEVTGIQSLLVEWYAAGVRFKITGATYTTGLPSDARWEIWLAGPYDSPGRYPIEPEFKFDAFRSDYPVFYTTYGQTAGKWYGIRIRLNDGLGRVGNWWEYHQQAA